MRPITLTQPMILMTLMPMTLDNDPSGIRMSEFYDASVHTTRMHFILFSSCVSTEHRFLTELLKA